MGVDEDERRKGQSANKRLKLYQNVKDNLM